MSSPLATLRSLYKTLAGFAETMVAPLVDLGIRLMVGVVFFRSGQQKLQDWESTVFLFEYEYQVPLLSPNLAAVLGTTFELCMPVLLILGLGARLAAVPLLGMAMVIQFVLGANNAAYDSTEHFYWMLLLLTVIVRGPGLISADHFIKRKFAYLSGST